MSLFPRFRFVTSSFALFAGLALVGCSIQTDASAQGQEEAAFSTPTTRELLKVDHTRTLSVAQGPDGSLHAVVDSNFYNDDRGSEPDALWYVTNATPSKEWKATKVFSPRHRISDAVTTVDGNHVAVAFRHGSQVLLLDGLTTESTDLVPEVLRKDPDPYGTLGFAMRNGALHVVTVGGPRLTPTYWSRPAGTKEWRKQVIDLPVSFIEGYEADFTSEIRLDATGRVHLFFGGDVMAYTVERGEPGSGTFEPVVQLPSAAKVRESTLALDATGTPRVVLSADDGLHALDLVGGEWRLTDLYRSSASYRLSRVRQVFNANGRQLITAVVAKYDSPDQEVRERETLMYFSAGAAPSKLLETVGDRDEKKDIRDVALAVSASGESSVLVVGGGTLSLLE